MTHKNDTLELPLVPPSVDQAPDGILDPEHIPVGGVTVRIRPYVPMTYRDHVYVYVGDYTDDIPISLGAVGRPVTFIVPADEFDVSPGTQIPVHYEVQFYQGERVPSAVLDLTVGGGFEDPFSFDLSAENYVVAAHKPPLSVPAFTRISREANWGTAPYIYSSSEPLIADVNAQTGEITAWRNGLTTITAVDSRSVQRSYSLTVNGIKVVHFLSSSADWQGMKAVCAAANLEPVSLPDIKRLWTFYYPNSGAVATYLGWLNYPFWTGDVLGAGTAWAYDLNGSQINENAIGVAQDTFLQAMGIELG